MALLLNIDTATTYGAVAISDNEKIIASMENSIQKEHASFLYPAINTIRKDAGILLKEVDAIVVTIGPGSYTGLRVGLTAAKGLCYALKKPLIGVNTLHAMALASIENSNHLKVDKPVLFAPMIDARRMEVYTGLYTIDAVAFKAPQALVVDEKIFEEEEAKYYIIFSGDGSKKLQMLSNPDRFIINESVHSITHVAVAGYKYFLNNTFENQAYAEPLYLKSFYSADFVKK